MNTDQEKGMALPLRSPAPPLVCGHRGSSVVCLCAIYADVSYESSSGKVKQL